MKLLTAAILALGLASGVAYAEDCDEDLVEYDPESAIKACQIALKKSPNDGDFQFNLGRAYDNLEEYKKAFEWYSKAANQGNSTAQYNLAVMYQLGEGVAQDNTKAIELYTKAANQGDVDAQYYLGVIYQEGEIAKKDYKKSAEWFTKAANQENAEAQFVLGAYHLYGRGVAKNEATAKQWFGKACDNGHESACVLR